MQIHVKFPLFRDAIILEPKFNDMEWLSTDLCEVKLKDKKLHFKIIVDRVSGFVTAYKLSGTKTRHIVACLQQFGKKYYGSPLLLTSLFTEINLQ